MAKLQRSGFHQAFRVFIPRMAQHLVRRADFDRAPVMQDQNAVRDVLHHAQIVGHHDDRHIGFSVADGFEGFKDPDSCCFEWVWALQARFENSFWRTLGNAFVFGVSNIGHTLALIAIDAVYVALLVASWFYMPQGLFLLLVLGYGTMLMLHSPILEHVFRKYISK